MSSSQSMSDSEDQKSDQASSDRPSVIAPSRFDPNSAATTSPTTAQTDSEGFRSAGGQTVITSKPNNYFSNNFNQKDNSPPVLAESRLSANTVAKSVLRPSVFRFGNADSSTGGSEQTSEALNPPKENKTFNFVSLSKEDISRPTTTLLQTESIIRCGADTTSSFNGEETPTNGSAAGHSGAAHTSVVTSTSSTADDTSNNGIQSEDSNSQTGFVFGQNLEERAVVRHKSRESAADVSLNKRLRTESGDESADAHENGSHSEATTSAASNEVSVIKSNTDGPLDLSSTGSADSSPDKSSEGHKRKYEVITGEEDEQNVLSMHCRLYAWVTDTSSWLEKGRGCLRLNDAMKDDRLCSRLVMRTYGALRVIFNSHLVSGMRFEMSNKQCLRFTNVDGIYLIKGAQKDIEQLNSAIDYRLREISKRHKTCKEEDTDSMAESLNSTTPTPPPEHLLQKKSMEELSNDSSV